MRKVARIFISLCVLLIAFNSSSAQGWRGIRPLRSTREDVERLIGPPMEPRGGTYDLESERVNIVYSSEPCDKRWPDGWDVPPGTVIDILVHPKKKLPLADLRLDLSKYKKNNPRGIPGVVYSSDEEGVNIQTTLSGEEVESIQFLPVASDKHLRCPEAAARESEIERGESTYLTPDLYYFDISPKEEQIRLEYFARRLQQHTHQSKIYIIGYAGQCASLNEAQTRTNQVKNYLVNKLGIEEQRIVTIDGGYRDDVRIQLYIVQPNKPKPLAVPNIHPKNIRIIKKGMTNDGCRKTSSIHAIFDLPLVSASVTLPAVDWREHNHSYR